MVGFRLVPFNVSFPVQTAGAAGGWVSEAAVTPVAELQFATDSFAFSKIAGIVVFTQELARLSNGVAEALVQRDLLAAAAQFQDTAFLDPDAAGSEAGPASVTYGTTEIASGGVGHIENDLADLVAAVATNRTALYFVMQPDTALSLARLRTGDVRTFPDVGANGGSIWGVPVITSGSVPASNIMLIDAAEVLVAEGDLTIEASNQATLDMNGSTTPNFSLWQRNAIGIKIVRTIRWQKRHPAAAAYLSGLA